MAAKIARSIRSRREQLRRLAVVFKVDIRLKIVAELYVRPMSPKEFHAKFGGGSVTRVAQHFEALEKHGWLRRLGHKERETKRRGPSETLFRATELAFFDAETWALLPYSLRLAFSWSLFKATAKELREGIEGACFEGRPSRDLTCTPLRLDRLGWTRVIGALDSGFESIFEEQVDAKIRVARNGGQLVRTGVLQLGFETPTGDEQAAVSLAEVSTEPPIPISERLAPVFADDLCMQIVAEANRRDISVLGFHREFGDDFSEGAVRHRFKKLKNMGWLVVVDKVKRRGAFEHIYRATGPAMADNRSWAEVPQGLRETEIWTAFEELSELAKAAIRIGSFDLRDDRHLSWSIVSLDPQGWAKVVADMEALAAFVRAEEERARKRIEAGAAPLTMVVALSVVESPIGRVKAP